MEILTSIYALLSGGQGVNPKIDSIAFRLHCGATTAALLAASAALTTRHLVGNPIDCIHTRDIPEDVLNTYCWIHSTFTVAGEAGTGAVPRRARRGHVPQALREVLPVGRVHTLLSGQCPTLSVFILHLGTMQQFLQRKKRAL
ncbi:uncharacterized protein LOC115455093 [Manduca sexta]|uniref:uncharacterized protein LOC115455093 n=1 Tax=Manduca sexta TaxID=7130 RepID=UPI00188F0971|nr:uncharacterized protein LOC115455093 [Manduca sexta]